MAQPNTFTGAKVLIKIGNGADPEVFTHPCLINTTRSIQGSVTTVDSVVPDCDQPEDPAWVEREKDSISYTITGEGMMDLAAVGDYFAWLKNKAPKNIQAIVGQGMTGAHKLEGAFHLTEFQISGERKGKATVSITLVSDGVVTDSAVV